MNKQAQKEYLENLYNELLMKHHALPTEQQTFNQSEMDRIDEMLLEIEKELTIEIDTTFEEVAEVETVKAEEKELYYIPELNPSIEYDNFAIELYTKDVYGIDRKIARFNVDGNSGYWVDLEGNFHNVKRWSTILNNLFKIDPMASLPTQHHINKLKAKFKEAQKELAAS